MIFVVAHGQTAAVVLNCLQGVFALDLKAGGFKPADYIQLDDKVFGHLSPNSYQRIKKDGFS